MKNHVTRTASLIAAGLLLMAAPLSAQQPGTAEAAHDHSHDHAHDHAHDPDMENIRKGIFEDAQIQDRPLSDWEGDWQSVFPLLQGGTLDEVMAHKAEHGTKTAEEYRAYYEIGYRTDVDRMVIDGGNVTFHRGDEAAQGSYASGGHEVLTYAAGNRGVRFIFEKTGGDEAAPDFIQFSDHGIFPQKAGHYHLYWGDDRAALLEEVSNWPTYYPSAMTATKVAEEMLAH